MNKEEIKKNVNEKIEALENKVSEGLETAYEDIHEVADDIKNGLKKSQDKGKEVVNEMGKEIEKAGKAIKNT